jgi:hypothetical protein
MLLQLGGHGVSIAQAEKIRIVTECPLPMQVDGEPVMLQSSTITLSKKNQALMLQADETSQNTYKGLKIISCNYFLCLIGIFMDKKLFYT